MSILEPLLKQLSILDKKIGLVPFEPNWAQLELLEMVEHQLRTTGRVRIIVLKARQMGISTMVEAILFTLCFVIPRYRALVLAHESSASQNLLAMTHLYWETYPFAELYHTKYQSKNDVAWKETGSFIKVDTAGKKGTGGVGRSSTVHFAHLSEVGFWQNPEVIMLGLKQTIPETPGTGIIVESTAQGIGNWFQHTWDKAIAGENEYTPLFFPWWKHPEYKASLIGLPVIGLIDLSQDEKWLREQGVDNDRLCWRRWAIVNKCDGDLNMFKQEYPGRPEDAFIASGSNVFPYEDLALCYKPEDGFPGELRRDGTKVWFEAVPHGKLRLFRQPDPNDRMWGEYMIGGDPTRTTVGDYACAQVINRRTLEQVAEWRGKVDAATFAEELIRLGMYFNTAVICPEITGPGSTTIGVLLGSNYPNVWQKQRPDTTPGKVSAELFGWSTTAQSKHLAIGAVIKSLVDRDLTIHSSTLFAELRDYVTRENGTYGPADENTGHDDTVMALAIGLAAHRLESPVVGYSGAETTGMAPRDSDVPPWER